MINIILRIVAEILLLVAGGMFQLDKFVTAEGTLNQGYFVVFSIVTVAAIALTITTYFTGYD